MGSKSISVILNRSDKDDRKVLLIDPRQHTVKSFIAKLNCVLNLNADDTEKDIKIFSTKSGIEIDEMSDLIEIIKFLNEIEFRLHKKDETKKKLNIKFKGKL